MHLRCVAKICLSSTELLQFPIRRNNRKPYYILNYWHLSRSNLRIHLLAYYYNETRWSSKKENNHISFLEVIIQQITVWFIFTWKAISKSIRILYTLQLRLCMSLSFCWFRINILSLQTTAVTLTIVSHLIRTEIQPKTQTYSLRQHFGVRFFLLYF